MFIQLENHQGQQPVFVNSERIAYITPGPADDVATVVFDSGHTVSVNVSAQTLAEQLNPATIAAAAGR